MMLLRDRVGDRRVEDVTSREKKPLLQRWIQSRLAFVSKEVNDSLKNYDAARAAHAVRSFVRGVRAREYLFSFNYSEYSHVSLTPLECYLIRKNTTRMLRNT